MATHRQFLFCLVDAAAVLSVEGEDVRSVDKGLISDECTAKSRMGAERVYRYIVSSDDSDEVAGLYGA
jgi:hypothetical protein